MENPTIEDRIYGCIYGGAIGDALGYQVEFSSLESILGRFGPEGVQELPEPALYSDDTQMTLRVARGLLKAYESIDLDVDELDECVANQLILWRKEDPSRAPGTSCLHGVLNLEKGVPYEEAGKPDSKGCGAVMRSAPYGILLPAGNDGWTTAAQHALMTHLHPAAQASAAGLAAGVKAIIHEGCTVDQVVDKMAEAAGQCDERTGYMVRWAHALACDHAVDPVSVLQEWEGWTGDEALAAALYCWLKNEDDYVAAVRRAATSPGDSDSLAAIAGNLAGAWTGISGIPDRWIAQIENSTLLADISRQLIKALKED